MKLRAKLLAISSAALCIVFLSACGGDDDAEPTRPAQAQATQVDTEESPVPTVGESGGGDTLNACDLITAEDAAESLGSPVDPAKSSTIGEGFSQCLYRIQGGSDVDAAVVIQARGDTSREDFDRLVEENAPEELGEVISISGLGDVAREQAATFVLQGDSMIVLTVLSGTDDSTKQQALARIAIGRLP